MRVLFAGTPQIAVPSLERVAQAFEVVGVLTAPDAAVGRGRAPQPSPVKQTAVNLGLPLLQPQRLDASVRERVEALEPGILVCVAYGKIFGPRFLSLFAGGGVNLHPSLLPRHRGPAPIPAAILAGDSETGITIQRLAPEMDAGDILRQQRFALDGSETTASLSERCATAGAQLLVDTLHELARGAIESQPQDHSRATYCRLIAASDAEIGWNLPAVRIDRMVRAYHPWPGAYTFLHGERLTIHESRPPAQAAAASGDGSHRAAGTVVAVDKRAGILVQTGNGLLAVRRLQLQSRKALDWNSFANGHRDLVGSTLGGSPH